MIIAAVALGIVCILFLMPSFVAYGISLVPSTTFLGTTVPLVQDVRLKVVSTFLNGFRAGILGSIRAKDEDACSCGFETPFWKEGVCAGLFLRRFLAPWDRGKSLSEFWEENSRYRFLLTIGVGFSTGLLPISLKQKCKLLTFTRLIDPRLIGLALDGLGFEQTLFKFNRKQNLALAAGLQLEPSYRAAFYEGVGRALWFLVKDDVHFFKTIAVLPSDCSEQCCIGYGIATGFAGFEKQLYLQTLKGVTQDKSLSLIRVGIEIALFARLYTDPRYSIALLETAPKSVLVSVGLAEQLFESLWSKGLGYSDWKEALCRMTTAQGFWRQELTKEEPECIAQFQNGSFPIY